MSKGQREPWRSTERHYCPACNTWMGSDRQSILIHEQGRKHKENVEKVLQQKRDDREQQSQAANDLQKALAHMNQAAVSSHMQQDVGKYGVSALEKVATQNSSSTRPSAVQPVAGKKPNIASKQDTKMDAKSERAAWESRKKKRKEEKSKEEDSDEEDEPAAKKAKRQLAPDEGNYVSGDNTYLEGVTFIDIIEEDMPVEVWIGSHQASLAEKRLLEKQHQWRSGLIIKVRRSSQEKETGKVLDVAYLKDAGDEDETLEKSVPPNRIRIVLGGDPSIPDTLEEAIIAATGGQVVVVQQDQVVTEVDEDTGLSTWGTVEIRKTTVRQEHKEDRERARQKRREEKQRQEDELKRAEGRRMEEARVENAEDSALGAYDVWNAGKAGYKGVNINATEKMTAADANGTSLSGGMKVAFKKKSAFKKGKKKQNRRITSADDL